MKQDVPSLEKDELLSALGTVARRAWNDELPPAEGARSRAALVARIGSPPARRFRMVLLSAALVAALLAVALLVGSSAPLAYRIEGSSAGTGSYLQPTGRVPATARFTDGTEIHVDPGGRARVVDTDALGARISLEQGRARFSVVHRPKARWSVEAGPFSIAVTGTEFDAEWSAPDGAFAVELRTGSVTVRGPLAPDGVGLREGQRLVVDLQRSRLRIEAMSPLKAIEAPAASASAADAPAAPSAPPPLAATVPGGPTPGAVGSAEAPSLPSFRQRVASGDFDSVIAEAEARGLSAVLASAPLPDIAALADAARYTGRLDTARGALLALRRRFPSSTDGRNAAFFLGRLAEDRGALAEAIGLYERYLADAPHGAFVAEALGRKMIAVRKTSGTKAARVLAGDYLRRFPRGPYASAARELDTDR